MTDHLNLQGHDPLADIPIGSRDPAFLDVQGLYEPEWRLALLDALARGRVRARDGVLACVCGPCYETPAEVRMLRALGADLVSMSTVPEAIAARYEGLRVAAVACVSNRGAGMDAAPIGHGGVIGTVTASLTASAAPLARAVRSIAEAV